MRKELPRRFFSWAFDVLLGHWLKRAFPARIAASHHILSISTFQRNRTCCELVQRLVAAPDHPPDGRHPLYLLHTGNIGKLKDSNVAPSMRALALSLQARARGGGALAFSLPPDQSWPAPMSRSSPRPSVLAIVIAIVTSADTSSFPRRISLCREATRPARWNHRSHPRSATVSRRPSRGVRGSKARATASCLLGGRCRCSGRPARPKSPSCVLRSASAARIRLLRPPTCELFLAASPLGAQACSARRSCPLPSESTLHLAQQYHPHLHPQPSRIKSYGVTRRAPPLVPPQASLSRCSDRPWQPSGVPSALRPVPRLRVARGRLRSRLGYDPRTPTP